MTRLSDTQTWTRCIVIVTVLALTCIYIMSQMDTMLITKYIPFMESQEQVDELDAYDEDILIKNHIAKVLSTNTKDTYPPEDDDLEDDDTDDDDTDDTSLEVLSSDIIYEINRWGDPLVIESYKLVFFTLPKVACTEWKLLFRKMMHLPTWPDTVPLQKLHDPSYNELLYIHNYTKKEATNMLISEEWTKAVIVREPKERVLSAFLNKFVEEPQFFLNKCCQAHFFPSKEEQLVCREKKTLGEFTYFLKRTLDCPNPHWTPQTEAIDLKWWNQMDFVGYMHSVAHDAETLLKSITNVENHTIAWEDYGKTGWGSEGNTAFMVRDTAHHATNAHDKLRKYYTPCLEMFVEKHWAVEWEQHVFHFNKFRLFDEHEYPDYSECELQ